MLVAGFFDEGVGRMVWVFLVGRGCFEREFAAACWGMYCTREPWRVDDFLFWS